MNAFPAVRKKEELHQEIIALNVGGKRFRPDSVFLFVFFLFFFVFFVFFFFFFGFVDVLFIAHCS